MGDSTNHTAPAVMASLLPLLKEFGEAGIKQLNVISDSPTSQYRNKGMSWLIKTFYKDVKKSIENLMLSNPSVPMYTVDDLLKNGLEEAIPSIGLYTYQEEDIIKFRNDIPKLKPMKGTMKLYEVQYILEQQEVTIMINRCYCSEGFIGAGWIQIRGEG